jgi:hypothetical protein
MTGWKDRPVTELIALGITGLVAFVVVVLTLAVVVSKLIHPEASIDRAAGQLADVIGALIALLAGIAVGRTTVNGKAKAEE